MLLRSIATIMNLILFFHHQFLCILKETVSKYFSDTVILIFYKNFKIRLSLKEQHTVEKEKSQGEKKTNF